MLSAGRTSVRLRFYYVLELGWGRSLSAKVTSAVPGATRESPFAGNAYRQLGLELLLVLALQCRTRNQLSPTPYQGET